MDPLPEPELLPKEIEVSEDPETSEKSEEIPGLNPLLRHILTGNIDRLQRIFEDPEDPYHSEAMQLVMEEDVIGRNLLFTACMAGQSDVIRVFAKYGVNLNEKTARGYTLLHCAAAWGQVETLKALVDMEVDVEALTFRNETARDVAIRYSQTECVDYLDFAELGQITLSFLVGFSSSVQLTSQHRVEAEEMTKNLLRFRALLLGMFDRSAYKNPQNLKKLSPLHKIQAVLTDPEKAPGKMNKEGQGLLVSACRAKTEWLELHPDATVEELLEQKQQLEDLVNPIFVKMATPRPVKSAK
ncbi:ankyrin repeat domain-containing protein 45 [Dromiciops gliroides]|uniref:ankyrin repeat domain-containing protein 45 n=1 Tax=Dromiciops gliroides TaxID=33562 RepID=UPI001CC49DF0|nr:ankyrin repeat domain-containing protein 45 [Dromiciops gliroides]